jgi:CRP-like cAMP-binding protein
VSEQGSGPTTVNKQITKFLFSFGKKKEIHPGQVFITEGEAARTIFVMLEGEAEILKRDEAEQENIVARVGQGTILGEMGVFMGERRTTSVRAATQVLALEFTADSFFTAIEKIPELGVRLIKTLSQKLKTSNDFIIGQRKAHNLLVVSTNIIAQCALEEKPEGNFSSGEKKEFVDFRLELSVLSKQVSVGRRALMSEIERLEAAGVLRKVKRQVGEVVGQANVKELLKFANEHTFPR